MIVRIILFGLILLMPFGVQAKAIKYNHNSMTISEVKEKVDFPILSPDNIPGDWTLEIKTYPNDQKQHLAYFRLHYMDKDDTILKVGIEQRKEYSKKEEILRPFAEEVDINGNKGIFEAWGNSGEMDKKGELVTGGLLNWTQNGTHIQMNSSRIPKEMILSIARSMKVVE